MGTNRRYAHRIDQMMDARILQSVAAKGELQTLTDTELEFTTEPITRTPVPRPVSAWVRFGTIPIRVDAEAVIWTRYAVGIRFTVDAIEHRTWVWASAVSGRG